MRFADLAESFVRETFPAAEIAVLAGSTAHGTRTSTSDIDLLLIGDMLFKDERSSLAATYGFDGEVFEVFAYTHDGFEEWAHRGIQQHRPVIVQMLLDGAVLRGSGPAATLKQRWAPVMSDGPRPSEHELDGRRYADTDLLDDLQDATDLFEKQLIAFNVFVHLSELVLLVEGRWIATGKHLSRAMRDLSGERTELLATPLLSGDLDLFADRAEQQLLLVGGRRHVGFTR
jgi:hypothetical protein